MAGNPGIDNQSPLTGKRLNSDGDIVNVVDMLESVYDSGTGALKTTATLVGDVTLGDLSIKDHTVDNYQAVNAAGEASVTVADGSNVAVGAKADAAVTNPALAGSVISVLKGILTNTKAAVLAAGTAVIGKVGIQVAGEDVAVGNPVHTIVTNEVAVSASALPTGAATQTTLAAVNAVIGAEDDAAVTNPASDGSLVALLKGIITNTKSVVLAAGTAVIGKVGLQVAGADVAVGNPVHTIVTNEISVLSQSYLYAIAEGEVPGHALLQKIGYNAAVGTTEVEIWSKGNTAYAYPVAAGIQMAVASSNNTADKNCGNGALTVTIEYLDASYAEQTIEVSLNGTARVNTVPINIRRVNSFRVTQVGSTGKAAGNISLTDTTGTTTYSYIAAGFTRARNSCYTVPLGKTLYLTSFSASVVGTKYIRAILKASCNNGVANNTGVLFYPYYEVMLLNSLSNKDFNAPLAFPATTDIKITAVAEASGSVVTCDYRGWLE